MAKNRIKTLVAAPLTRAEVEALVGEIREAKIMEQKTLAAMNAAVQAAQARYAEGLAALKKEWEAKVARVQKWAEANPDEFAKKRSIEFTHGVVGFRKGTPKLTLLNRKWTWDKVLGRLKELGNHVFIRTKEEVDKESILSAHGDVWNDETIAGFGVQVTQDESFFVDPVMEEVDPTVRTPSPEVANA